MTSITKIKRRMLVARRYADHYPDRKTWTGRSAVARRSRDRHTLAVRRLRVRAARRGLALRGVHHAFRQFNKSVRAVARAFAQFRIGASS